MDTDSYKASCVRPGEAVICNFLHPGTLTLSAERHSARMSKITNDGLTRSDTGMMLYSCTRVVAVGVKGLIVRSSESDMGCTTVSTSF